MTTKRTWVNPFLDRSHDASRKNRALIILNQPFSFSLLERLWLLSSWHCCADGGANRLHDVLQSPSSPEPSDKRSLYKPDLVKGDLDSLRDDVRTYYSSHNIPIIQDHSEDTTDLMKCLESLSAKEKEENVEYEVIILGGLSGRLDQTVHTLSILHKLRKKRQYTYSVTDDNIGWVLDEGEHSIMVDHQVFGPTCGLLPVGVTSTILTTAGLRWNLDKQESGFDGLVSTSNHLLPQEPIVTIQTSQPIWWCMELRSLQ